MQPPPNRPGLPPNPPRPGGMQPPPGYAPGPQRPPERPAPPPVSPQLAAQVALATAAPRRPGRGFLRFFAGACISSAWLTLILSIVLTVASIGSVAAIKGMTQGLGSYVNQRSQPTLPGGQGLPTGDLSDLGFETPSGGGGGPALGVMGALADMGGMLALIGYVGAALTLLTGLLMWLLFLGLGKLTHAFLDLEEQSWRDRDALQALLAAR